MRLPASILAATLVLLGISRVAHADMTVVSETTISGMPTAMGGKATGDSEPGKPFVSTFYYQGDHKRSEIMGRVMLTGGSDGKVYTLDPVAKTYYVTDIGADSSSSGMQVNLSNVSVSPGGDTKSLLGHSASDYKFEATMTMTSPNAAMADKLPTVKMHGVIWATTAIPTPNGINLSEAMTKFMPQQMADGMKDMVAKFAVIKGFPVVEEMHMDYTFPEGSPMASMAKRMFGDGITVHSVVKSVSEAPVSADLFVIPADYKQVDAASAHMPRMPGNMR